MNEEIKNNSENPNEKDYSVQDFHAAVERESDEISQENEPMPIVVFLICIAIFFIVGIYLGSYSKAFLYKGVDISSADGNVSSSASFGQGEVQKEEKVDWIISYEKLGEKLYKNNCSACHGATGDGIPGAFPPIKGSEYVVKGNKIPILVMLNGLIGPVKVLGSMYNGSMQAWKSQFIDEEIGAIVTFMRKNWGNNADVVFPDMVTNARKEFGSKKGQYTEADLKNISFEDNIDGIILDLKTGEPIISK